MRKKDVINYFGNQQRVADAIGASKGTVSQWDEIIPESHCAYLQKLTNGALIYDETLYGKQINNTTLDKTA